jgi:hypothetical protein
MFLWYYDLIYEYALVIFLFSCISLVYISWYFFHDYQFKDPTSCVYFIHIFIL